MTEGQPWYFEVATTKFVVMSIVTFGIYDLYWVYQQWQCERARTGEDLSPFWRTFFTPIWTFSLFRRISRVSEETGTGGIPHQAYALIYFLSIFTVRLPDPYWLISVLGFVPMIPVQSAATRVNQTVAPGAPPNDRYTLPNVVMIVVGLLMLLLVIVGMLLPVDPLTEGPVNVSV